MSLPRPEADIAGALPILYTFLSAAMPALAWFAYLGKQRYDNGRDDDERGKFSTQRKNTEVEPVEIYKKFESGSNELQHSMTIDVENTANFSNGHVGGVSEHHI